ncbi:MAG TPA: hypothetical protein V6D05_07610 [Stenomitos sp.]
MLKRLILGAVALTLLGLPAHAETLSVEAVVAKLQATQAAHHDVVVQLSGELMQGPKRLHGELEIQAIPAQNLRRVEFKAPSQMAGNLVIIEKDQAWRYLSLTNQVVVSSVAEAVKGAPLDFSKMTSLMGGKASAEGFKLAGSEKGADGVLHVLESTTPGNRMKVWVKEDGWRLQRLQVLNGFGQAIADWQVTSFQLDRGLQPADLKRLPKDAEVLKR